MPTEKSLLGAHAEDLAAKELVKRGYTITTTNYSCRRGEIDIIADDRGTVVFVEVRSRRSSDFVSPGESITIKKQTKLIATAQYYLMVNNLQDCDCRFDVAEVRFQRGLPVSVEIIQNAFGE